MELIKIDLKGFENFKEYITSIDFYEAGGFTGTQEWHRYMKGSPLLLTDGALDTVKKFSAIWLCDVIHYYMQRLKQIDVFFVLSALKINDKGMATIIFDDGNYNPVIKKELRSDLSQNLKFYLSLSEGHWVLMLPSEY